MGTVQPVPLIKIGLNLQPKLAQTTISHTMTWRIWKVSYEMLSVALILERLRHPLAISLANHDGVNQSIASECD